MNATNPFGYCLNPSTINAAQVPLIEQIEIAARAGFQAIEPWVRDIDRFVNEGGAIKDIARRITDAGLDVAGVIGFFEWIVNEDDRRARGIGEARRAMDLTRQIGGHFIAAPPFGAVDRDDIDLRAAAERYRILLEIGDALGVIPEVEFWGRSKTLGRLGEAAAIAIDCGHPKACILADVYHIFKSGSDFAGLRAINGAAMHVFHFNDYPAHPDRAAMTDADRIYPGDGIAPLSDILRDLNRIGFRGYLSLELFNAACWSQDPLTVARTGLEKMQTAVRQSLEGN